MKFKRILLILTLIFILSMLWGVTYPEAKSWVNDYSGVLSRETTIELENLITELKQKTDVEVAVAIVKNLEGIDKDTYANELFKKWGIGSKNDEGLLILVSVEDRKIKVETGYGLEGILPDGKVGRILDQYVVPLLKENNFDLGIKQAVYAYASVIAQDKGVELTGLPKSTRNRRVSNKGNLVLLAIFIFLVIITRGKILWWLLILNSFGGSGRGGSGGFGGGGSGGFGGFGGFGGGGSGGGGAGRGF